MWFKNLRIYRLARPIDLSDDRLESALAERAFVPCGKTDQVRSGFVPVLGDDAELLSHRIAPFVMLASRRQEKILPPAAINEVLTEKLEALKVTEGRPASRREKSAMRDEVMLNLLPRALTRSQRLLAYFDLQRNWLIVDTASANQAENFLDLLRSALGELPVIPIAGGNSLQDVLSRWLTQGPPAEFELDAECELRADRDARNTVRYRNQELGSDELAAHLKAGKRVTELALNWRDALRFVLTEEFVIKRVRWADRVKPDHEGETEAADRLDLEFAAMTLELYALINSLLQATGLADQLPKT